MARKDPGEMRRRSKIQPNSWAANILVSTAVELRNAVEAYPALAARRLAGDDSALDEVLDLAQRIAAIRRAVFLRADEVRAGVDKSITPLRAGVVLCRLECALVALVQEPPDERAQLDDVGLDAILDEADLRTWMGTVIAAAEKEMGER
jgi:hypothetical protein